jgi:NTE family protein
MSPRIAISLGSSFQGYATHAGFICRLRDQGLMPAHVAGASAGALAAGLFAAGIDTDRIRRIVLGFGLRIAFIKRTIWGWHQLRSLLWSRQPSCIDHRAAVAYLRAIVGDRRLEDLHSPRLTIALTDLDHRQGLLADSGPLATAMVASCSVPWMFPALAFDGRACYDGGIAHEIPIDQWIKDDRIDLIIVHRIKHGHSPRSRCIPGNALGLAAATHDLISDQLLDYRVRLAQAHGKQVRIIETQHPTPSLFSTKDMIDCFQLGADQADKLLLELRPPSSSHD